MYRLTFANEASVLWAADIETLRQYVYDAEVTEYEIVFIPNEW